LNSKIKLATEGLWLHHRRFLAYCFELGDFSVLNFLVLTKEIFGEGEFATDLILWRCGLFSSSDILEEKPPNPAKEESTWVGAHDDGIT
jgi:hypothetical protein